MSTLLAEFVVYGAYLLAGPVTWSLFGAVLHAGRRRMELIERPASPIPSPAPRVTILIPAKDEGARISDCVRSALAQDYPDFRVIAIDDRSTDGTGAILDELAASNPALRVLHIRDGALPAGWTGKCNALHTAMAHADGDYLLFVDSDVILQPDALSATMSLATRKNCDLVSLLPRMESGGFFERLLVPLAGASIASMYLIALTNHDHHRAAAFANGQYLLIRRDAYNSIGGHAAVRGAFCEDVEIARRLKSRKGTKLRLATGTDLAAVRMYSSLPAIVGGWSRNFYAASHGAPWRILSLLTFLIVCCVTAYAAIAWGVYRIDNPIIPLGDEGWLLAGAVHWAAMTWFIGQLYAWSGNPRRNALVFPLAVAGLIWISVRSLAMCLTGNVEWRGTRYRAKGVSLENQSIDSGPQPVADGQ